MTTKKYYWLKLKEDFFEEDTIEWLEEQENGVYYSNFYLKLCLKGLKNEGILIRNVGDVLIPYDLKKLAEITRVKIDTVIVAMELFKKIGLVQILENGEIYLTQLELMVGSETSKAQIMRNKRAKDRKQSLKKENNVTSKLLNVTKQLPKSYTEIEKDKDKELDKEQETKKEKDLEIEKSKREKRCSSCGDYIYKYGNVIEKSNICISCCNKKNLAIDLEEINIDNDEVRRESIDIADELNKDMDNVYKHFEKCGFTITDKLKEFIKCDIKTYGMNMILKGADECVKKGKANNYSYLTGILQNWNGQHKEENGKSKGIANSSAYTPIKSILDE